MDKMTKKTDGTPFATKRTVAKAKAGTTKKKNKSLTIKKRRCIMLPVMFKNSWFPTVFEDFMNNDFMPRANTTAPAVNVKVDEKAYTMEVAAPGIKKEFCRISINDEGNLSIAIENKVEHKESDKKQHYLRREFSYTNYEQAYTLPEDVDRENITAKVEHGILTVTLPRVQKKEQKCSRNINIG
jgi:HSP20 family protein